MTIKLLVDHESNKAGDLVTLEFHEEIVLIAQGVAALDPPEPSGELMAWAFLASRGMLATQEAVKSSDDGRAGGDQ